MLPICCLPFWNPPSLGLFLFFHLDSVFHLSLLTPSCSLWTYFQQFLLIVGLYLRREFCLVISKSSRGPKRPLQASPLPHTASRVSNTPTRLSSCSQVGQLSFWWTSVGLFWRPYLRCPTAFLCFVQHSCWYNSGLGVWVVCPHLLIFMVHEDTLSTSFVMNVDYRFCGVDFFVILFLFLIF